MLEALAILAIALVQLHHAYQHYRWARQRHEAGRG